MKNLLVILILVFTFEASSQSGLANGPMVGHAASREVKIWVQTYESANVMVEYWIKSDPDVIARSTTVKTRHEEGFTAVIILDKVRPGTLYEYTVILDNEKLDFGRRLEFETPVIVKPGEALPEFSLAFGSCVFINDTTTDAVLKGGDYEIFQSIADKDPELMFWLGDNIYLRPEDWDSDTGFKYRYTQSRQVKEMAELLSSVSNYAIWDDHDFGPNDSDRSYIHKEMALYWFKKFWANPGYGLSGYGLPFGQGIVTAFTWGDVDFFLTDNRYFRTPQKRITGEKTVLGKAQLEWLIDALKFSEANFKVVVMGNLFLSSSSFYKNQNFISNYNEERAYLLSRIEQEAIKNVIFITGDKHFAELSKYVDGNKNPIYELTSSPLTANVNTREDRNTFRVAKSHIQQRNFGMIDFQGKSLEDRSLVMRLFSAKGKQLFEYKINLRP